MEQRRWWRVVGVVMALVVLAAVPAAAGTAEDPEIADRCGDMGTEEDRRVVPDWADICSVWFETLSEPEATPELRVTLRAVDLGGRLPATYGVWWVAGDCLHSLWHQDEQAHLPQATFLNVDCAADEAPECTVELQRLVCEPSGTRIPLPDDAVQLSGTDVTWTLRYDGALAAYAEAVAHDTTIHVRGAMAGGRLDDRILLTFGCSFGTDQPTRCQRVGGDVVFGDRDYVVGT